jgi:coenzyme F420-reducing hydrogenase beta subunit
MFMGLYELVGMSKIEELEKAVHGRSRNLELENDLRFGVTEDMLYARNVDPVKGAQWTGIVTKIAVELLRSGKVDAVVCVQSAEEDRYILNLSPHGDGCIHNRIRV